MIACCGLFNAYPCERLDFIFEHDPAAKTRLDAVHRQR